MLLIDEAYADFHRPRALGYDSFAPLVSRAQTNVLVLRTFSKGFSLAGLRLGYLLGVRIDLIEPIATKTRDSYNIDFISQRLGHRGLAAIANYAEQTWAAVRKSRASLG